MNNVTGWNELYSGNLVGSAFTLFDTAMGGWFVTLIFFAYLGMVMYKTKSTATVAVAGMIFVGLYAGLLQTITIQIIAMVLVLTLAGVIYHYFNK